MKKRTPARKHPADEPEKPVRKLSIKTWIAAGVILVAAVSCLIISQWDSSSEPSPSASAAPTTTASTTPSAHANTAAATYVGAGKCSGCHQKETSQWRTSQHAEAMQHATDKTVLGKFEQTRFTHFGITSTFFKKGGDFWVNTEGPDGKLADFKIAYTFGVEPLQQYLVAFPDGRMQALPLAWDTRAAAEGGQRWFHMYPDERIDHNDELFWTRGQQNWNFMCADCHSTNLRRNFDVAKNTFATTWSDINVACESCHGPGSKHIDWANKKDGWTSINHQGLAIPLNERKGVHWERIPDTGNVQRSEPLTDHREIQTCAVCHARRRSISSEPGPTGHFLDTHDLDLLTMEDYFPDGQVKNEDYVYGSFLQSKMYAKGVTCTDCHNPHTGKLRLPGNATCTQCHAPSVYDVPKHTHHNTDSTGAQCANCHMPTRTYMVVDPRRDHSFRIPRPDQSDALGTPNACTSCHTDKSNSWAAKAVDEWFGSKREGFQTWGKAFRDAEAGSAGAADELIGVFNDQATPDIARATALTLLRRFPGQPMLQAVTAGLQDDSELVRIAALDALTDMPAQSRSGGFALIDDPRLAVRTHAGFALAPVQVASMPASAKSSLQGAFDDYVASQDAVASRPESHLNLGLFHSHRQQPLQAEKEYREAIRLDPTFAPAYVNLADLYRAGSRDDDAAKVLDEGLKRMPDDPSLLQALALQRVRQGHTDEALPLLERAFAGAPTNTRVAYVYAVALQSSGHAKKAADVLDQALQHSPNNLDLLFARASFAVQNGDKKAARPFAERFAKLMPNDPQAQQLLETTQ